MNRVKRFRRKIKIIDERVVFAPTPALDTQIIVMRDIIVIDEIVITFEQFKSIPTNSARVIRTKFIIMDGIRFSPHVVIGNVVMVAII